MTATPTPLRELIREARREFRDSDAAGDVLDWLEERTALSARDEAGAVAPWPDFAGHPIRDRDRIRHPDGTTGTVLYLPSLGAGGEAWRVVYEHGEISRLALQVGDKGQAVVIATPPASGEAGAVDPNVDPRTGCYPDCEDQECDCREQATYHAGGVNYFLAYEAAQKTGVDYNQLCRALRFIFATPPAASADDIAVSIEQMLACTFNLNNEPLPADCAEVLRIAARRLAAVAPAGMDGWVSLTRGFDYANGIHTPTVLVTFKRDDWEARDRFAKVITANATPPATAGQE